MIKLIVTDIDGCLTSGGISRFDLAFFQEIQRWNRAARCNPSVPPITVCTGRPQPYVEAIVQLMDCYMPAICESGGVFYDFSSRTLLLNPAFTDDLKEKYQTLFDRVTVQFLNGARPITLEPGKFTEITLIPYPPLDVDTIWDEACEFLQPFEHDFRISRTRSVVNFSTHVIDKGKGIEWLSEKTDIMCKEMAGFGDSAVDALFLKHVTFPGCPDNAVPEVKKACQFTSAHPTSDGFMDFLKRIEGINSI